MGIQKEINNNRCCIIAGGTLEDPSFLKRSIGADDYVICADSGLRHALQAGVMPHLIVGDFDSYTQSLPQECEIIRLPVHKDDTDLLAAAKLAVQKGYTCICMFGALGTRPDQSFAALQNLAELNNQGVSLELYGPTYRATVLKNGSMEISAIKNTYLSVFAFGGDASGVTLAGVEYPLTDSVLPATSSVGVSNHIIAEKATVTVKNGTLLIWLVKED